MAEIPSVSRDGLVVCVGNGKQYKARDTIDAALFRGELKSIWEEFLSNLGTEKRAKELALELDYDAVEEMAERFRYDHDLITAEETERWLEDRGLTLEDFSAYFARRYWRSTLQESISAEDVDFLSASAELRQLFTMELILDDELELLNKQLMWRLAVGAAKQESGSDPEKIAIEREQFLERNEITSSKLGDWLDRIGRDEQWLKETLAMEVAYQRVRDGVLNPQARKKQLAMLRMPLTRFEAEVIEVESLDAAREALLCIRDDGMSMQEVAGEARYPYRRITFRQQDVPPNLQQKFWSAGAGDLLEPLPRGEDGFELYRITNKIEPDLSDTIVEERIDERLLEQHFSGLIRDHIDVPMRSSLSMQ